MFAPDSALAGFKSYVRIEFIPKTEAVVNSLQVFSAFMKSFDGPAGCARLGMITICIACFW
jgi:hypothetical protein